MTFDMVDAFLLIRRNQLLHMKPGIEHSIESHVTLHRFLFEYRIILLSPENTLIYLSSGILLGSVTITLP